MASTSAKAKGKAAAGAKTGREDQLLQQALSLFSNGGYRETSLQEIADKLGITRPLSCGASSAT